MHCKTCKEKFDNLEKKSFELKPCTHKLCEQCLSKLSDDKCPFCFAEITNINSETNSDRIKSKIEFLLNETFLLKANLNENHEKKMKENLTQFQTIRSQIIMRTNQIVDLIHKHQKELLGQVRKLENNANEKLKSFLVQDKVEDEVRKTKQIITHDQLDSIQLEKIKVDYHFKNLQLNLKLIESEKNNEYIFEFFANANFKMSINSIGTIRSRNKVINFFNENFYFINILIILFNVKSQLKEMHLITI